MSRILPRLALASAVLWLGGACSAPQPAGPSVRGEPTEVVSSAGDVTDSAPTRLVVPDISLDETLIDLGIASDATMEVPERAGDAGWLTTAGRPGEYGPTVIAGHVDSRDGPGVFYHLTRVRVGALITVYTAGGEAANYRVSRVEDFPKSTFPTEAVFGATLSDELRLITCTGEFDDDAASYRSNRVVFADRV